MRTSCTDPRKIVRNPFTNAVGAEAPSPRRHPRRSAVNHSSGEPKRTQRKAAYEAAPAGAPSSHNESHSSRPRCSRYMTARTGTMTRPTAAVALASAASAHAAAHRFARAQTTEPAINASKRLVAYALTKKKDDG